MRLRTAQSLFVILVLASYMLAMTGIYGSRVLCAGVDGHVEIEFAGQFCDTSGESDWIIADADSGSTITNTASCIDIPISIQTDSTQLQRADNNRGSSAQTFVFPILLGDLGSLEPSPRRYIFTPASHSDRLLVVLRSTVLLV